ncbi:secretin N-terminal domain-containing protein [Terriglobus sp. 2YAB30_2]|uniref:secretin N-terminal domain-containing protein n=3 Tax=unclassified Terriglobus TaxID=2628988 RepID=UPI003F9BBFC7
MSEVSPHRLVLIGVCCCLMITGPVVAQSAKAFYKQGETAEAKDDFETALKAYGLAYAKKPDDLRYKVARDRVRFSAAIQHIHRGEALESEGHHKEALVEFLRALEIDPSNRAATQQVVQVRDQLDKEAGKRASTGGPTAEDLDRPGPPVHLAPFSKERITLHMTEGVGTLYQTVGKVAGINVLLDPELPLKRVSLDLQDVGIEEALRVLEGLSGTFWTPTTSNTIYVAQDTRTKRTQIERLSVRTFYLSNATQQQDLNEILTALRNLLPPTTKIFSVMTQNAIVIRGTPDEIMLAKSLIQSLDRPKPEVLIDVYVMEVRKDKLRNIGISLPTSLSVTSSSSSTLNSIGSTSSYSYSIGQAAVELLLTDSDTRVLQQPSIRAIDGQKAMLKIGQRIPIATGSYTTATSTSSSAVQTQFQYIDVGVNLDITPTIHQDRDVTMKLAVEVSSQSGSTTISGVSEPIISQQKAEQMVRLKDGEVNILAGLVQKQSSRSVGGTPGLGEIPAIKYMFSTQETETVDDEIVFMLVPHVVRTVEVNTGAAQEIETGGSESIQLNRVSVPQASQP